MHDNDLLSMTYIAPLANHKRSNNIVDMSKCESWDVEVRMDGLHIGDVDAGRI